MGPPLSINIPDSVPIFHEGNACCEGVGGLVLPRASRSYLWGFEAFRGLATCEATKIAKSPLAAAAGSKFRLFLREALTGSRAGTQPTRPAACALEIKFAVPKKRNRLATPKFGADGELKQ